MDELPDCGIVSSRRWGEISRESSWGLPFANDPCLSSLKCDNLASGLVDLLVGDLESIPFARIVKDWVSTVAENAFCSAACVVFKYL